MEEWFAGKRVALIGNAMSLFDKEYGAEIDSHEVVVRLNKAAMLYTSFDVPKSHGTKTTHWLFFNTGEYKNEFARIDKSIKKMHVSKFRQTSIHRNMVDFMMPLDIYYKITEALGYDNPTTGFMSLYYIDRCKPESIDVYGFDWKDTPTFTDPERKKDPSCDHRFHDEKRYCFDKFFTKDNITWRN